MTDWQDKVHRSQLVCSETQQPIPPGETFYSALIFSAGHFIRHDYSQSAWKNVDRDPLVSWWCQQRPQEIVDNRPRLVNNAVLLGIFHDLRETTERPQQCFLWLLGLLLMRNKKLKYLGLEHVDGEDYLLLEERGANCVHRLRDPHMSDDEQNRVQDDLNAVFDFDPANERTSSP